MAEHITVLQTLHTHGVSHEEVETCSHNSWACLVVDPAVLSKVSFVFSYKLQILLQTHFFLIVTVHLFHLLSLKFKTTSFEEFHVPLLSLARVSSLTIYFPLPALLTAVSQPQLPSSARTR